MRARFCLAAMLAIDFDVYLIDEGMPTTADQGFNARAEAVLAERLRSATAVIVSHQPWIIERFCSHTAQLRNGRISQPAPVPSKSVPPGHQRIG
jgi:capsular polysaccharide transport system ATP-binding protein